MWHKVFEYKKIGGYWRPIIPITLKYNNIELQYVALLDSGADFNIFHSEIASVLDIDLTKLTRSSFSGINIGSTGLAYMAIIEIGIEDYLFSTPIYFSHTISPDGYGIVGQLGFFDKFKVMLDYKHKNIELKRYDK